MVLDRLHNRPFLVGISKLFEHGDTEVPKLQIGLVFYFNLVDFLAEQVDFRLFVFIKYLLLILSNPKYAMDNLGNVLELHAVKRIHQHSLQLRVSNQDLLRRLIIFQNLPNHGGVMHNKLKVIRDLGSHFRMSQQSLHEIFHV